MMRFWLAAILAGLATAASAQEIGTRDHVIPVQSAVPAIAGQTVKLYLRERGTPAILRHGAGDKWCCSSTAPARRPKSASTSPIGLQLDGLSRRPWL